MKLKGEIQCSPYELPSGKKIPVKFKYNLEWTKEMANANQSSFDPNVFLNQELSGANETKFTPVPEAEYAGYIDDLAMDKYDDPQRGEVPILILTYALLDDDGKLKALLGLEKPTVQDRLFLDVNPDGSIAFGPNKNVRLGRVREAVGQNDPKKKWNFNMLRGAGPVLLKIVHTYDKKTGEGPYSRIDRIVKKP